MKRPMPPAAIVGTTLILATMTLGCYFLALAIIGSGTPAQAAPPASVPAKLPVVQRLFVVECAAHGPGGGCWDNCIVSRCTSTAHELAKAGLL